MKKYNKEFIKGKQSFFQRVIQEDEQISRHFVGLVAAIKTDLEGKHTLTVSDGTYCLDSEVISGSPTDKRFASFEIINREIAESKLKSLIETGKICVGQKLHFVCQGLSKTLSDSTNHSKHYFIQNE